MAFRSLSLKAAIFGGLSFCAVALPLEAWADHLHPGRVIERGSNAPVSADVKAWAKARQSGDTDNCPEFGEAPVDARTSNPADGKFELKVPTTVRTYTVVYCANGYHRKVDRHLPNDEDGSPVVPLPARLRKQSDGAASEADAVRLAVFALNELAYLYEVNPDAFFAALKKYSAVISEQDGQAAEVMSTLPDLVVQWASP